MDCIICCKADDVRDDGDSNAEDGFDVEGSGKLLECDYDTTCTKLYKSIESKSWEEIIYFLETGKWYFDTTVLTSLFFGSGPDPRVIESRTWVTALDEMGSVRWCQLPLHAAITFQAPFEVIKKLVEVYPESVRCADDQDMLPLHYTFRFGSEDKILAYILEEFPQALKKKALRDRLPLDMAHYSSRPERGVIIECYVETSVADVKANLDDEATSSSPNAVAAMSEELRSVEYELMEAKKIIRQMEEKLQDARTGPPTARISIPWSGGSQRAAAKEKRDEESTELIDPTEASGVDKKQKGFGIKFGRQKKQTIS